MGLDMVEIVLAVEDEFGVHLPDDWGNIRTVGDLDRTICCQLETQRRIDTSACPSFEPFFATRDAILSLTTADPRAIRPSSMLATLFVANQRRAIWLELQSLAHLNLPPLRLPPSVSITLKCTVAAFFLTAAVLSASMVGPSGVLLSAFCAVILLVITFAVSRPFAIVFPKDCQSVGDIVGHASPSVYPRRRTKAFPDSAEIYPKLVNIVSDRLDVPVEDIAIDSRFIEDLKCD